MEYIYLDNLLSKIFFLPQAAPYFFDFQLNKVYSLALGN